MSQYNTLNAKLSQLQLNKLKYPIKNRTKVTLNLSSNVVGDSDNENNFSHKLLLTNTQVSKLRKAFANKSLANIKSSKTQQHKVVKSGGFLGRLLGPLIKIGLPLTENALKPLAKSVTIRMPMAMASATGRAIHKNMFGSGFTTLITSNEEVNDIIKIVMFLEESGLLKKGVGKTTKNETKEQKGGFLGMLLGTLGASLLGNLLTGTIRSGEGTIRAGENF